MLLASVAAGREYHVMHCDGTTLRPPPEGFDSVGGVPVSRSALNEPDARVSPRYVERSGVA